MKKNKKEKKNKEKIPTVVSNLDNIDKVKEEYPVVEIIKPNKKLKKKRFAFCNFLKQFFLWMFIILFLEFSYRLLMNVKIDLESSINIVLYTMAASALTSMILGLFKGKLYNFFAGISIFVITLLFGVECIFTKIFQTSFSLTNLGLGDQAAK